MKTSKSDSDLLDFTDDADLVARDSNEADVNLTQESYLQIHLPDAAVINLAISDHSTSSEEPSLFFKKEALIIQPLALSFPVNQNIKEIDDTLVHKVRHDESFFGGNPIPSPIPMREYRSQPNYLYMKRSISSDSIFNVTKEGSINITLDNSTVRPVTAKPVDIFTSQDSSITETSDILGLERNKQEQTELYSIPVNVTGENSALPVIFSDDSTFADINRTLPGQRGKKTDAKAQDLSLLDSWSETNHDSSLLFGNPATDVAASASMELNLTMVVEDRHEEIISSFKRLTDEMLKFRKDLPAIKKFIKSLNKEISNEIENPENLFNELINLRDSIYQNPAPANSYKLKLLIVKLLILIHISAKKNDMEINNDFYRYNYALVNDTNIFVIENISDEKIKSFDKLYLIEVYKNKIEKLFEDEKLKSSEFINSAKRHVGQVFENAFEDFEKFEPETFHNLINQTLSAYKDNIMIFEEFFFYIQKLPENIQAIYKKIYEPLEEKRSVNLSRFFTKSEIEPSKTENFNQYVRSFFGLLKKIVIQFNTLLPELENIIGVELKNSEKIAAAAANFSASKIQYLTDIILRKVNSEDDVGIKSLELDILQKSFDFCENFELYIRKVVNKKIKLKQISEESLQSILTEAESIKDKKSKATLLATAQKFLSDIVTPILSNFDEVLCDPKKNKVFKNELEQAIAKIEQRTNIYLRIISQHNECYELVCNETKVDIIVELCLEKDAENDLTIALASNIQALREQNFNFVYQTFSLMLENPEDFASFDLIEFKQKISQRIRTYVDRCKEIKNYYSSYTKPFFSDYSEKFTNLKQNTTKPFCDFIDRIWEQYSQEAGQILLTAYSAAYENHDYLESLMPANQKIAQIFEHGFFYLYNEKKKLLLEQRKSFLTSDFSQIIDTIHQDFKEVAKQNWNQFLQDHSLLVEKEFESAKKSYFGKVKEIIVAYMDVISTFEFSYNNILEKYGSHEKFSQAIIQFKTDTSTTIKEFFQLAFSDHANFERSYNDNSILNDHSIIDKDGDRTMSRDPNYLETIQQAIERFTDDLDMQLAYDNSPLPKVELVVTEDEATDFETEFSDSVTENMAELPIISLASKPAVVEAVVLDEKSKENLNKLNQQVVSTVIILKRLDKKTYKVADWKQNSKTAIETLKTEKEEVEKREQKLRAREAQEALINILKSLDKDFVHYFGSHSPAAICLFLLSFNTDFAKGRQSLASNNELIKEAIDNIETLKKDIYQNQNIDDQAQKKLCIIRFWQLLMFLNNNQPLNNQYYQIHKALLTDNLTLGKLEINGEEKDVIQPLVTPGHISTLDNVYKIQQQQTVTESNINKIDILVTKYGNAETKKEELKNLKADYKEVSDSYYKTRYANPNVAEDRTTFNQSIIEKLNDHLKKDGPHSANNKEMKLNMHTGIKPYLYGLASAAIVMSAVTVIAPVIYAVCRWINIRNYNNKISDQNKHKKLTSDFFPKPQTQREIEVEKITNDITAAPAA